ncbi:MAG: hypothetical protein A2951_01850 [Candidatus Buchananbacteria bacterium RIFCSPLOWO2_01_FULL_56_15]|uniref:TGS domain-containing protein n=2 Tax=Candidatus Buchananiibacteriota TaxID=1817903 RepID=A0A1G1YE72_9BACT|nr:MAG: hypothetical protein A3J59_01255 [Candidatus Buchananbacteria bacterium RIFCSPHIGHO2_02_FULL_56_16]OGY55369.1 MAG: hypothetical protein A2951_01850 [Candidatus Buchananbacteria bacterium RIFCSPLOWO2_01_FULL_56_15]
MVKLAFEYAQEAHRGQTRKSGGPYIEHCLATAITLAQMGMDQETIIAGLLHDVPEDTAFSLVDIEKNFGSEVATLVAGITKLGKIKYRGIERYSENLRKMFISMAQDIRTIVIKMADRLHNLETLQYLPAKKQRRIAEESLEIYAPIADRLGMGQIKGEIEDQSFPYVNPEAFEWMQREILPKVELKKEYIERVIKVLAKELADKKLKVVSISGRPKRIYSLYHKLLKAPYDRDVSKIYDLVAARVIVPSVADCYHVLGIVHQLWKPLRGRVKDFISQPKPNGYRSLHTTVFGPEGKIVEIQIRTPQMHAQAEYGIAAHWYYKEAGDRANWRRIGDRGHTLPKKLKWIEDLVSWQKEISDSQLYLTSLTLDAFGNRIFVFTPKGDVIDLPEAATPVDFAYHVHTFIGDHCAGARINNQLVSLDTALKSGDVCEIITDKNRKGPSRDWLRFAKTTAAKAKIRANAPRR